MATSRRLTDLCSTGGCAAKYDPALLGLLVGAASTGIDPDILVGLSEPDDAAVVRIAGESAMVFSVDFFPPIVDDPADYGRIAANNALSDIFAMGGRPRVALAIAAMPADLDVEVPREIVGGATEQCEAAGAALVGGHTITAKEPTFGLAVVGFVEPDRVWRKAGAAPGDALVLTKPLGSGLAVTARRRGRIDDEAFRPIVISMLESNGPAADLLRGFDPHAVTDVTGFGLLGHAAEMAKASGVRLEIALDRLPLHEGVLQLASSGVRTSAHDRNLQFVAGDLDVAGDVDEPRLAVALDPQTAGGLLVAVDGERAEALVQAFRDAGLAATRIGSVLPGSPGVAIR